MQTTAIAAHYLKPLLLNVLIGIVMGGAIDALLGHKMFQPLLLLNYAPR